MPTVTLIPSFNRLRYGDRLNVYPFLTAALHRAQLAKAQQIRLDAVSSQLQRSVIMCGPIQSRKCLTITWLYLVPSALDMCLCWARLESVHISDKRRQVIYLAPKLGWKGVRGWSLMNCKYRTCGG
ncbi:hypothetical protein K469DRAFT_714191 [Zopfia rhizophila CBS 207.26]|uniref:Uncharacterized protein n=1 Tax=Zopfia rhizophila CBS 207.26 TaxID=1314779 RepID=A0A6A6DTI3_9PEZI|nr:hypothetical protein K469DRAFT_714191 [Zopfia rhizophila CBS 207.26]